MSQLIRARGVARAATRACCACAVVFIISCAGQAPLQETPIRNAPAPDMGSGPDYKLEGRTLLDADEASRIAIEQSLATQVKPPLDKPLRLISFKLPPYPRELRGPTAEGGKVRAYFNVGANGELKDAAVISSDHDLAEVVRMSLRSWRFDPITRDGRPVELPLKYEFVFRLED